MFVDYAKIYVKAGNGGNGAVAWRREKFEPAGGPAGGDGGDGGNIIIETDEGIRTLMDFQYKKHYKGDNGEEGRNKKMFGSKGEDIILKVPVGTLVKDAETQGVIVDLREPNQSYVIAKGGKGGRGNARFATATRQAPNFAEPGTLGEERDIVLELKLLADVGLVGFPNVGKSTILSTISSAKPKIDNYHFTTLKPNLGVVKISQGESYVIADIPGLIEGAHEGIGLGHDFLRHVERTKVLAHVIDISGFEGRDPVEDFNIINNELYKYNDKLKDKKQIVIANKMDLPGADENLERLKEEIDLEVISVSAATSVGIKELKFKLWELLNSFEYVEEDYETFDDIHIEELVQEEETISVRKEDGVFIVEGEFIDKLLKRTYMDSIESLRYFQKVLKDKGVIERLEELDIMEHDTVVVGDFEFEYLS